MKYILNTSIIWEIGQRDKQEDYIFPIPGEGGKEKNRLFILCDGMGGHSAGEVASKTVCNAMSNSILTHCHDVEADFSDDNFKTALNDAYDALDSQDNGASKKMGTTLAFLKFHSLGCTIAHIGDSRVYHIRPGKDSENTTILFETTDHSLINDLIKIGELTPEEAKHSQQKNIITRAMQPHMERRYKADIYHTHDIKPGDYFMLCSDGILETIEDENIKNIFSEKGGDLQNKTNILTKVTKNNHDNHSAILIQVVNIIDPISSNKKISYQSTQSDVPTDMTNNHGYANSGGNNNNATNKYTKKTRTSSNKFGTKKTTYFIIIFSLICIIGCVLFISNPNKVKENTELFQSTDKPVKNKVIHQNEMLNNKQDSSKEDLNSNIKTTTNHSLQKPQPIKELNSTTDLKTKTEETETDSISATTSNSTSDLPLMNIPTTIHSDKDKNIPNSDMQEAMNEINKK